MAITSKSYLFLLKEVLLDFEVEYPDVLKEDNLDDILSHLMERQKEEEPQGQMLGY